MVLCSASGLETSATLEYMRDKSKLRDLGVAALIVLTPVAAYFLVSAGIMTLMIVGFVTPFWLILVIAVIVIVVRKRRDRRRR